MNTYKELISNEEFFAAALLQVRVFVIDAEDRSLVDYGGPVQKYTEFAVRIGGTYYQRHLYIFKVFDR
ncbi:hypothetical protein [Saccharibacillus brassicae]|uniref:Uncharacterized protein n=1 Tax=Saccharibacillus brassicae TaxID=2583377 RepID=A0A4Y6V480_SACBS|nr:hypothetical protein [Saccharibacillus brassicae]QDH23441.1 hypothetical protein FFV09_22790 [Saccharibacillus brassicae]